MAASTRHTFAPQVLALEKVLTDARSKLSSLKTANADLRRQLDAANLQVHASGACVVPLRNGEGCRPSAHGAVLTRTEDPSVQTVRTQLQLRGQEEHRVEQLRLQLTGAFQGMPYARYLSLRVTVCASSLLGVQLHARVWRFPLLDCVALLSSLRASPRAEELRVAQQRGDMHEELCRGLSVELAQARERVAQRDADARAAERDLQWVSWPGCLQALRAKGSKGLDPTPGCRVRSALMLAWWPPHHVRRSCALGSARRGTSKPRPRERPDGRPRGRSAAARVDWARTPAAGGRRGASRPRTRTCSASRRVRRGEKSSERQEESRAVDVTQ
jgi:hypothetical protein